MHKHTARQYSLIGMSSRVSLDETGKPSRAPVSGRRLGLESAQPRARASVRLAARLRSPPNSPAPPCCSPTPPPAISLASSCQSTAAGPGEVYATEAPGGEAAVAVHRGPYDRMNEAYNAIDRWMAANRGEPAGRSWEIYGDPAPDLAHAETTVMHLLK